MKYLTTLTAKAEVVQPHSDEFKAVAASLRDRYGFDLKPQMDLLYVRSCLVSAGPRAGVNDNDDIFTREEVWGSRHTPVLKPFNWQHKDKDILGVIYTVQARDLEGVVLDINDDDVPSCDFDLWVEAAIFSLIHKERAAEIESRSKANTLFVSMEAWFDDYSYGLCNQSTGTLSKIIARNKDTSFLDRHLRAGGGVGVYRDPGLDQDMRIGRVLKSITFGGCGFVDRPANKRSTIEAVEPMDSLAEQSQVELLLQQVLESQTEDVLMNTHANSDVSAAVESALDKREKIAAKKREREALVARADNAEQRARDLQVTIDELTSAKESREAEFAALQTQVTEYGQIVEKLVKDQIVAGATDSTPPEIAAIDAATDGDSAFRAKLSWLEKSMASLRSRACRAQELEKQLAEAEAVVREQDVRALLGSVVSEEALETFITYAAQLDEASYTHWRDEKELMILEITNTVKTPASVKQEDKPTPDNTNAFEALLSKRRAELIGYSGDGANVDSGVSPEQLRTPRHKIAGSAGDDSSNLLETAQADESGVSLAGAQTGDDGAVVNGFRVLANLVVDGSNEDKKNEAQERPDFDPVR